MDARIVVVENDEHMRDLLTWELKRAGWQVFAYAYRDIDLSTVQEHRPDLIILDFNMRDGGIGWEFLQILKMEKTTANIPLLITTTSFHLPAEVRGFLLARYISVVHKPFDLNVFLALVQKTLMLASQQSVIFSSDRTLPILVVDDTDELRDTMTTVLGLEGYQVVTAENGLVALDNLARAEYCLILLDISMPIMNGFEFMRAYDQQLGPHTPVIIVSGEKDIRSHILPTFVMNVLHKPFEINELLAVVGKYAQPV